MIGIMSNTEQEQVKIYDAYYNKGYNKGRTDYEAECEKIFEDNPPMHFNREQIFWIKEYIKHARAEAYEQGRANAIDECIEKLYEVTPHTYDQKLDMVFVNALKQLKEQKKCIE